MCPLSRKESLLGYAPVLQGKIFVSALYSIHLLCVLRKYLVIGWYSFSVFTLFSLITINRETSYDSYILCQDYRVIQGFIGQHQWANLISPVSSAKTGIIWGLLLNHMRFGSLSGMFIYGKGLKQVGLITASDQTVWVVYNTCPPCFHKIWWCNTAEL